MHNTTWIELDADALRHNASIVKQLAAPARILAMVKANGYGHGADWVAESLQDQVDGFGVARIEEAIALRATFTQQAIVLLGGLLDADTLALCAEKHIDLVIHTPQGAHLLADTGLSSPLRVWLKMNTGMNRLGLNTEEFNRAHALLCDSANVSELIHMTHFSDAEVAGSDRTTQQYQALAASNQVLGKQSMSAANSAAIIAHPNTHANWVRPGIMLYGDDPTESLAGEQCLQPVMSFYSKVVAIHELEVGQGVGYNRRWHADAPSRIATIAVGYGDGYPRHAPDGTPVLINGKMAALAGRVSMDLLTVDISQHENVKIGDRATLWGKGLPAADVARHCGTISYQLFTGITGRVARSYS